MTEHRDLPEDLRPEPARRAPDSLHRRVSDAIDAEPVRRRRVGRVLAPIAAGSVLIAGVFGAVQLNENS
ncbi:MAG: hypothetical protein L0G99_09575, partial [Propionibacteriales bacterium]|nr:hypothetical protein [Propionibacteriales bacterium]